MNFEIDKAFNGGFEFAKKNYLLVWVNGFLAILSTVLASITIVGILIVPAIWAGYIESCLRIRRGKEVKMGVFFKAGFSQWGSFFILTVLCFLGFALGFLLLIIPGIYLMIAWYFVFYLKIDNPELTISEVFSKSMELVSNIGWFKLFLFALIIALPVNIIDIFTFNLASVILFPFIVMIQVEAYILASGKEELVDKELIEEIRINEDLINEINDIDN